MSEKNEAREATANPEALARRLIVDALGYAAGAMLAFTEKHPREAAEIPPAGPFSVRLDDILSPRPRVALIATARDGKQLEVAHSHLVRLSESLSDLH